MLSMLLVLSVTQFYFVIMYLPGKPTELVCNKSRFSIALLTRIFNFLLLRDTMGTMNTVHSLSSDISF